MKKILKLMLAIILVIPCTFTLTGCLNGGTTINFETWGGSACQQMYYESSTTTNNIRVDEMPTTSKPGYNFSNWCYDEELTQPLVNSVAGNMIVTYYAKYTVNLGYFDSDRIIEWTSINVTPAPRVLNASGNNAMYILLTNAVGAHFNKVTVAETAGSNFVCGALSASDTNGKPLADANDTSNIFELETSKTDSYIVIKLFPHASGEFKITIE